MARTIMSWVYGVLLVVVSLTLAACPENNSVSSSTAAKSWGTAVLIQTDSVNDASRPQIAVDASGNALAVWNQSDGTRDNIWANRYTAGERMGNGRTH